MNRRYFVMAGCSSLFLSSVGRGESAPLLSFETRTLSFYNLHTGEEPGTRGTLPLRGCLIPLILPVRGVAGISTKRSPRSFFLRGERARNPETVVINRSRTAKSQLLELVIQQP